LCGILENKKSLTEYADLQSHMGFQTHHENSANDTKRLFERGILHVMRALKELTNSIMVKFMVNSSAHPEIT
jgi:hypothetical protein